MADQKISELTELAEVDVDIADVLPIVDTSTTTTKKFSWSSLRGAVATYIASFAQVLTNKTIDGDTNTIQDLGIASLKTVTAQASTFLSFGPTGTPIASKVVPTGTVVGTTDVATLTNKVIDGDDNTVQDLAILALKTNIAQANNFLSFGPTGTPIATKAVPTGTVVGTTDTATLTNKTLTGPIINGPSFGGTAFGSAYAVARVVLSDGATVTLNAALGNEFILSASGDRTIAAPTNPMLGQKIIISHLAVGSARTLSLATGTTNGFQFGTDITALTATGTGKCDLIGCIYDTFGSANARWLVVAYVKGYF